MAKTLLQILDDLDDGQDDCEPIAQPIPGLTAGHVRYLKYLVEKDQKLMYAKGGEQLVWLVWELAADRPTLAVICTTDEVLQRYVTDDRKSWRGRPGPVFCEKVMADHLYGAHDASIAMNLMRRSH